MSEDATPRFDDATIADRALDVVTKAESIVDHLLTKANVPPRPSAAAVASKRPASAEPKVETQTRTQATLIASRQKVNRADALEAFEHSFDGPLTDEGRKYLIEIPIEGRPALGRDPGENAGILASLFTESQKARANDVALTAALGCSPAEPMYGLLPSISSATGGVLELPEVSAPRGSVVIAPAPSVFNLTGQTGVGTSWTSGTKTCYTDTCVTPVECDVSAHYSCVTTTNTQALFYPEKYDALISEVLRAHAQAVNAWIISQVVAESVPFGDPGGTGGGAIVSLFKSIALTAGWYRARYRADLDLRLEVVLPSWVADVLSGDQVSRDSTTDYGMGLDRWITNLRRLNVNPQFVYSYQASGSSPAPPQSVDWLLFPTGAVFRLRGKTIELGTVRDSVLNAANQVQFFAETWDGICVGSGLEIVQILDTPFCASGATGDRATILCDVGS